MVREGSIGSSSNVDDTLASTDAPKRSHQESVDALSEPTNIASASLRDGESKVSNRKKIRKRRKTFSCDVCRKFKTRCDFEPLIGKCHRCNVLQIECSLTKDREDDILAAIEESSKSKLREQADVSAVADTSLGEHSATKNPFAHTLAARLNRLEEGFNGLSSKIDIILLLLQRSTASVESKQPSDILPSYDFTPSTVNWDTQEDIIGVPKHMENNGFDGIKLREPPLKLIGDINERLFPTEAVSESEKIEQQQRPFVLARLSFLRFYEKHKELCHNLSREFLVRSHFWIIPGGIKEINEQYAREHTFITSVFTIIAMSFDDNDKYSEEQELLYPLVERLLTNTLTMFEKLTDFDIEAILYCCMFNISRKTKRHRQLKFNSLVLSNFAIQSFLNVVDFHKIKERVLVGEQYIADDLYHLRILNSLTACNLEYSISYGNVSPQDSMVKEFNNLTAKFPQANFGDDIKISEINLGDTVNSIFLHFKSYFKKIKESFTEDHAKLLPGRLIFPELTYWLKNWEELLSKDGAAVLLFTYDFYQIMLCRSFISEFMQEMVSEPEFLQATINTMKEHAFSLTSEFLKLPPTLIKGAPIFTTHQLVYACLTLSDFLHWFEQDERQRALNICTRVYWHLNTIGEKTNDVTETVGKVIKSIIDTSKTRVSTSGSKPASVGENTGLPLLAEVKPGISRHITSGVNNGYMPHAYGNGLLRPQPAIIPDVDQFNSFEDFFQDFFDNLKPTTQRMFVPNKRR